MADVADEQGVTGQDPVRSVVGRVFPHPYGPTDGKGFSTFLTLSPAGDELTLDFAKTLLDAERLGQGGVTLACLRRAGGPHNCRRSPCHTGAQQAADRRRLLPGSRLALTLHCPISGAG